MKRLLLLLSILIPSLSAQTAHTFTIVPNAGTLGARSVGTLSFQDKQTTFHTISLKAADSIAANVTFTLPDADGIANSCLRTNGAGIWSFGTCGAGGLPSVNTIVAGGNTYPFGGVTESLALFELGFNISSFGAPYAPGAGGLIRFSDNSTDSPISFYVRPAGSGTTSKVAAFNNSGNFVPAVTDTFDLGANPGVGGAEWNNLYVKNVVVSGTISGGAFDCTAGTPACVAIGGNTYTGGGAMKLGTLNAKTVEVYANNTLRYRINNVTGDNVFFGNVFPGADATYALGDTTLRWTTLWTGAINASGASTLSGVVTTGTHVIPSANRGGNLGVGGGSQTRYDTLFSYNVDAVPDCSSTPGDVTCYQSFAKVRMLYMADTDGGGGGTFFTVRAHEQAVGVLQQDHIEFYSAGGTTIAKLGRVFNNSTDPSLQMYGNIYPDTTDSRDIGSDPGIGGREWNNLYVKNIKMTGTITGPGLDCTTFTPACVAVGLNAYAGGGAMKIGSSTNKTVEFYANNTLRHRINATTGDSTFFGTVAPGVNDTYDLGFDPSGGLWEWNNAWINKVHATGYIDLNSQVRDDSIRLYSTTYTLGIRSETWFAQSHQTFRLETTLSGTGAQPNAFEVGTPGSSGNSNLFSVNNGGILYSPSGFYTSGQINLNSQLRDDSIQLCCASPEYMLGVRNGTFYAHSSQRFLFNSAEAFTGTFVNVFEVANGATNLFTVSNSGVATSNTFHSSFYLHVGQSFGTPGPMSGDTIVNGAMYYDTNINKLMALEAGTWKQVVAGTGLGCLDVTSTFGSVLPTSDNGCSLGAFTTRFNSMIANRFTTYNDSGSRVAETALVGGTTATIKLFNGGSTLTLSSTSGDITSSGTISAPAFTYNGNAGLTRTLTVTTNSGLTACTLHITAGGITSMVGTCPI